MSDSPLDDFDGDSLPQSGDRLQILSPEEYELLWGFPRFTQSDRDLFFTLTAIKRQPRDFSYQQLLAEIERGQQLRRRPHRR
jgi:hypothetical protein